VVVVAGTGGAQMQGRNLNPPFKQLMSDIKALFTKVAQSSDLADRLFDKAVEKFGDQGKKWKTTFGLDHRWLGW